jgi:hypothetical protein
MSDWPEAASYISTTTYHGFASRFIRAREAHPHWGSKK